MLGWLSERSDDSNVSSFYLVAWDITKISESERRRIYRKLNRFRREILKSGRFFEWIQKSVILVESKEDALAIASLFEGCRVKVYKIIEEVW